MTLIRSISGIRGTVGGIPGEGLTPPDIVRFVAAYCHLIRESRPGKRLRIVIGRDARHSGPMISRLVTGTLMACGVDVIDLDLSTTPTVEIAVTGTGSDGGIIITASHNPGQWNALKLLNSAGEFLSAAEGEKVLSLAEGVLPPFIEGGTTGTYTRDDTWLDRHIRMITAMPLVNVTAIRNAGLIVAFDAVNSSGAIALPPLLEALGVRTILPVNAIPDGNFAHNPEPLPSNLGEIMSVVRESGAHLGFAVDPDVDRLAVIADGGSYFGEEYTLVAVADYVLKNQPGNTVSNLSSTRALSDVTVKYGGKYFASAVGEVNVVSMMKKTSAVIGGEGNGGVIYPPLHYGRDALAGIALFLSALATSGMSCSAFRKSFPDYYMSKEKVGLSPDTELEMVLARVADHFKDRPQNTVDGLRIEYDDAWVHLRKSNTEPIIRIYAEAPTMDEANRLAGQVMEIILR